MVVEGAVDINLLIGILVGAVIPTLIVILQNRAERKRQVRDHALLVGQFRAELLKPDLDAIEQFLDEMTETLRIIYGLRIGETAQKQDVESRLFAVRNTMARASWRSHSLPPEIREAVEVVVATANAIIGHITIDKRLEIDRDQVKELGDLYDQQAGAVRKEIREYQAKVRVGEAV